MLLTLVCAREACHPEIFQMGLHCLSSAAPMRTIFAGVWDSAALITRSLCLCFVWAFKHSFKDTNQMMLSSASDVSKVTPFSIAFLAAVTYKE